MQNLLPQLHSIIGDSLRLVEKEKEPQFGDVDSVAIVHALVTKMWFLLFFVLRLLFFFKR